MSPVLECPSSKAPMESLGTYLFDVDLLFFCFDLGGEVRPPIAAPNLILAGPIDWLPTSFNISLLPVFFSNYLIIAYSFRNLSPTVGRRCPGGLSACQGCCVACLLISCLLIFWNACIELRIKGCWRLTGQFAG